MSVAFGFINNTRTEQVMGLFGWAVAVKKVDVGCELWKKQL
jgi:hypothetical protein